MSSELVDIHIPLYMKNPRLRPFLSLRGQQ